MNKIYKYIFMPLLLFITSGHTGALASVYPHFLFFHLYIFIFNVKIKKKMLL